MPGNEIRNPAYLWDMLDAARAISAFIAGRAFAEFQSDRMLRNAGERNMEIIGKAANRISDIKMQFGPNKERAGLIDSSENPSIINCCKLVWSCRTDSPLHIG